MYRLEFWLDNISYVDALANFIQDKYEIEITKDFDNISFECEEIDLQNFITQISKYITKTFNSDFDFNYEEITSKYKEGFSISNPYTDNGVSELSLY